MRNISPESKRASRQTVIDVGVRWLPALTSIAIDVACLVHGGSRDCTFRWLADFGTGAASQHFHGVPNGGAVRSRQLRNSGLQSLRQFFRSSPTISSSSSRSTHSKSPNHTSCSRLSIFLIVAIVTSALAGRVRDQARAANEARASTRRLYEFTWKLSGLTGVDAAADGAAGEIHTSLRRPAVILLSKNGELSLAAAWPPEDNLESRESGCGATCLCAQ